MRKHHAIALSVAAAALGVAVWLGRPAVPQEPRSIDALAARAAALERDITRLEDVNAIKKLQRIYGFYTDKQLWSAAADLFSADGTIEPWSGATGIFITPGYRFRTADVLMTNFHLPKSTLFMLVSAFSGLDTMRAAYAHSIDTGYRFYSYGDASLLFREDR